MRAPAIVIDESGLTSPMISVDSKCEDCGVTSSHLDTVVLRRLQDVPELLRRLPFDPEFPFSDVYLHRTHTSNLTYDITARQGAANALQKITKLGAEEVHRRGEAYVVHGQVWFRQLASLVADQSWEQLSHEQRTSLAALRGEYLFYRSIEEKIPPLGAGGGRHDPLRWNIPELGSGVLRDKLLSVLENRREELENLMCAVGARKVVAIDWCYQTGKLLGGKLLANFVNEDAVLMQSTVTKSESINELLAPMKALRERPNFSAKVAVIDKVPPSLDDTSVSKLEAIIRESLGVQKVIQDRFHVSHNLSKWFNNSDPRYHQCVIIGWRHATVVRRASCETVVDQMLKAGEIQKKRRDTVISIGHRLTDADINDLKGSGRYHDLFSSKEVLVPEDLKPVPALKLAIERWAEDVIEASVHPPDEHGVRHPILLNKKTLIASVELIHKIKINALKRILNCVPPPDMDAWEKTGETDQNGIDVWKSVLHTCGVESINAAQVSPRPAHVRALRRLPVCLMTDDR